jgi:pimeloyl-ACP methyl ester carboxylesterase
MTNGRTEKAVGNSALLVFMRKKMYPKLWIICCCENSFCPSGFKARRSAGRLLCRLWATTNGWHLALENVIEEYGYDYFKFRSRWLVRHILSKSAIIARFRPFDIKPVDDCRDIEQPILMVHGDADEKIPIAFDRENFAALKSLDKEFFVVKGAGHDNVGEIGGAQYRQKVFGFLNRILKIKKS